MYQIGYLFVCILKNFKILAPLFSGLICVQKLKTHKSRTADFKDLKSPFQKANLNNAQVVVKIELCDHKNLCNRLIQFLICWNLYLTRLGEKYLFQQEFSNVTFFLF